MAGRLLAFRRRKFMARLKLFLPAAVLAAGLIVPATLSFGKAEYVKPGGPAAGQKCTVCHKNMKNLKELTDVGTCFKDKKDLAACQTK
jgi:hypothetical protein